MNNKPGKDKEPLSDMEQKFAGVVSRLEALADWPRQQALKKKQTGPIRYATFNDRVFASVIDTALSFILLAPFLMGLSDIISGSGRSNPLAGMPPGTPPGEILAHLQQIGFFNTLLMDYTVHYVIFGILILWLWNRSSCTPGKWALKMRIVDDGTYCKPSPKQFTWRYLGYVLSMLPLTLGFFWILFDKKKRAWHDMVAGTVVVKVEHWRFTDDGTTPHVRLENLKGEEQNG